jgi:cytochrome c-type biogenesis protein CcmF
MDIQYIGEHLFYGYAGRFSLFLAFIAALFAAFAYFLGSNEDRIDKRQWRSWGRRAFGAHAVFVILASAFLLLILLNRFYEYRYVWIHAENDLSIGYLIAGFWAGQEGSLLFWILSQALFGMILIRFARDWEAPVMTFMALAQIFMLSMVLGLRFGDVSIGMNPFLLLRESPENLANHFFHQADYVSQIADGNGLNPLLRNFWMLSHPPITFIGYAAVLVPFCYAMAALWKKKFHAWIKPALPWTILGMIFLGAGILLGGVWAYEALSFGGFWAWDPIENASLVPWLILVAGMHLMLVSYKRKHTYFPAFLFIILSFLFVLYATYLTRSGVLSETSVHSFGTSGIGRHIMVYIAIMLILAVTLLIRNYRNLPSKQSEEVFTREFWLFVGALVLVLSAFQIIFTTSIPVFNHLLGTNLAPPVNVVHHYNSWQLPFAVTIALLIAFTQFISWGRNDAGIYLRTLALSLILSVVCTLLLAWLLGMSQAGYVIMLFASLFALFSSLDLLLRFGKKYAEYGAIISHLGMALFLLAVLLTFSNKEIISKNTSGYFIGNQFPEHENLLLLKDEIVPMGDYHVRYVGNSFDGNRLQYQIDFLKRNREGAFYKTFSSFPSIQLNERMGNVYEPYAKIFLPFDVFTYITFAEVDQDVEQERFALLEKLEISINDSMSIANNNLVFVDLSTSLGSGEVLDPNNVRITALMEIQTHFGETYSVQPSFVVEDGQIGFQDATVRDLDLMFRFRDVSEKPYTIVLEIYEIRPEFIIIKTVIFPYINLLWFSMLVMLAGLIVAFRYRWKLKSGKVEQEIQQ